MDDDLYITYLKNYILLRNIEVFNVYKSTHALRNTFFKYSNISKTIVLWYFIE